MHQPYHLPVLYAEHCPDQPTIPSSFKPAPNFDQQEQMQDQISRATRVVARRQLSQSYYTPKIIKSKPPSNLSYEAMEHERELRSMKKRIKGCKNVQQRKKDRNDPIIYPPYFIRDSLHAKDVRIDGYSRQVLGPSYPMRQEEVHAQGLKVSKYREQQSTSRFLKPLKKAQYSVKVTAALNPQEDECESFMPSPAFIDSKRSVQINHIDREKHTPVQQFQESIGGAHRAQQWHVMASNPQIRHRHDLINLPDCNVKSVMDHIWNKSIFREQDLQVLRSRLSHAYGERETMVLWSTILRLLGRQ